MRRRLLLPLISFAVVAVLALAVPAMIALARTRTQEVQLDRSESLAQIAALASGAQSSGDPGPLNRYLDRFHAVYGEAVAVLDASGLALSRVGRVDLSGSGVELLVRDALRGLPRTDLAMITPWSPAVQPIAVPVSGVGTTTGAVVLAADLRAARSDITWAWLGVSALAVILLSGAVVAANRWVGWVLRPVRALDSAARHFPGRGALDADSSGPPEVRQLAESLSRMATGLQDLVDQQRSFVADASHQLRNPLAAVRLRLDGLVDQDADSSDVTSIDRDLDRLELIVDRMLVLAAAEHRATAVSTGVGDEIAERSRRDHTLQSAAALAAPYRDQVERAGQHLETTGTGEVRLACRRSDLEEIVGNLIENAGKYAGVGATVTVRVESVGAAVEVVVEDDGPGLPAEEFAMLGTRFWRSVRHTEVPGTGLGLAIVRQLVVANQGELEVGPSTSGGLRVLARFAAVPP